MERAAALGDGDPGLSDPGRSVDVPGEAGRQVDAVHPRPLLAGHSEQPEHRRRHIFETGDPSIAVRRDAGADDHQRHP